MNQRARGDGYVQDRDYRPPTSPAARCAGRASSSACSSSSTWPTSPGARPTRTSCGATCTATSSPPSAARPVAIIYIVANVALGIHLFHGAWSMFQSLGLNNPGGTPGGGASPSGFAALITAMNVMFPISVLTGIVDADDDPDCRTRAT